MHSLKILERKILAERKVCVLFVQNSFRSDKYVASYDTEKQNAVGRLIIVQFSPTGIS
jgi:hypothetical protein